jgi:predicted nuclease of predicted toxin-antitoxin system
MWAGDWPADPGDDDILATALRDRRILVTLDKDFGELAVLRGQAHAGIIRIVNMAARRQAAVCLQVAARYASELAEGAIVTAEPGRLRIRTAWKAGS